MMSNASHLLLGKRSKKNLFVSFTILCTARFVSSFDAVNGWNQQRVSAKSSPDFDESLRVSEDVTRVSGKAHRNLDETLRVAEDAARKAGKIMYENQLNRLKLETKTGGDVEFKSSFRDIVTPSDIACQEKIYEVIQKSFPQDKFLGEESVASGTDASVDALQVALDSMESEDSLLWIVDPIDGTTNFQAGLPVYCASIGAVNRQGEVLTAVIYNPMLDEIVTATKGGGCRVNGRKLNNDNKDIHLIPLQNSIINIGFPVSKPETLAASSRAISAFSTKVRGLRMFACASQVMAWVAQKKLNAYISWDLNSWDICAGLLVVNEAGGFVSDFQGNRATVKTREMVILCQGAHELAGDEKEGCISMHREVLDILKDANCLNIY